jgi:hypothetical protein
MLVALFVFASIGRSIRVTPSDVAFSSHVTFFGRRCWERPITVPRGQIVDVRFEWLRQRVVVVLMPNQILLDLRLPHRSDMERFIQVFRAELGMQQTD